MIEQIPEPETVTIPKRELENTMAKAYNILNMIEDTWDDLPIWFQEAFGQQGFEMNSRKFADYFKQYKVDVE